MCGTDDETDTETVTGMLADATVCSERGEGSGALIREGNSRSRVVFEVLGGGLVLDGGGGRGWLIKDKRLKL